MTLDDAADRLTVASGGRLSDADARRLAAALVEHGLDVAAIVDDADALAGSIAAADGILEYLAACGFDHPGQAITWLDGVTSPVDVMVRLITHTHQKNRNRT